MEKQWIESFYKECGREVSLAYNVLNQTNTWGVTLGSAVLTAGLLGAIKVGEGNIYFNYPNIYQWYFVIVAWIIMLRFFVRSALGLANMYRWNFLIKASTKVLSLPEGHMARPIFLQHLCDAIDAYFYSWKSPIKRAKLFWENLRLMYLWFFLIILVLFIWGLAKLPKNTFYWLGVAAFMVPLVVETIFFLTWNGLKYHKPDTREPDIVHIWKDSIFLNKAKKDSLTVTLILGFCAEGPYKHASDLLAIPGLSWIPWTYHISEIDSNVMYAIANGEIGIGTQILFASWHKGKAGAAQVHRVGKIDYLKTDALGIRLNLKLEAIGAEPIKEMMIEKPDVLCFIK
jgi:hypothetical protein